MMDLDMVGMTITSVDVIGEQYVDRLLAQESREPICGLGHRRPSESHLTRRVVEARRAEAAVGIPQLLHSGDPEQSRTLGQLAGAHPGQASGGIPAAREAQRAVRRGDEDDPVTAR